MWLVFIIHSLTINRYFFFVLPQNGHVVFVIRHGLNCYTNLKKNNRQTAPSANKLPILLQAVNKNDQYATGNVSQLQSSVNIQYPVIKTQQPKFTKQFEIKTGNSGQIKNNCQQSAGIRYHVPGVRGRLGNQQSGISCQQSLVNQQSAVTTQQPATNNQLANLLFCFQTKIW